jgi:hypothetical protein
LQLLMGYHGTSYKTSLVWFNVRSDG